MMEVFANKNCSMAVTSSSAYFPIVFPGRKRASRIRVIASGCVFWIGMALIGIVAVPAGILFCIIRMLARATSFLTDRMGKG